VPSGSRIFEIFAGSPVVAAASSIILGSGPAGDLTASRRLVHPDSDTFPELVYPRNPDRTTNLDNQVLPAPLASVALTLTGTRVTRFERSISDTLCTEIWEAGTSLSMLAPFFRLLYEYLANPPAFDPVDQPYILWEPRDRTDRVYEVELVRMTVGQGGEPDVFDVKELRAGGGKWAGGDVLNPLDALDTVQVGVLDREVRLTMRVVAEVEV
jgi:hypothetical protein